MKYWYLAWEKYENAPFSKSSLAGNGPGEMGHVLPGGLQEHSAGEPALSCEVLLWVLGTSSSLWTTAQANYSVGFIWLPEGPSYAGGWSGCVSKAQDFLFGEKTSCVGLWLKPIPESGHKYTQWSWVRPSPDCLTPVPVSALTYTQRFFCNSCTLLTKDYSRKCISSNHSTQICWGLPSGNIIKVIGTHIALYIFKGQ